MELCHGRIQQRIAAFHSPDATSHQRLDGSKPRLTATKTELPTCHPPVTLVTLKKGCRRPVHRRSVTLSPFLLKNSVSLSLVASRYISLSPQSCQVKCHKVTKRTTTKSKNCLGIRLRVRLIGYNNCTKNARTNMVCVLALNEIGLLYFSSSSG